MLLLPSKRKKREGMSSLAKSWTDYSFAFLLRKSSQNYGRRKTKERDRLEKQKRNSVQALLFILTELKLIRAWLRELLRVTWRFRFGSQPTTK
jgi:hypothetical protein